MEKVIQILPDGQIIGLYDEKIMNNLGPLEVTRATRIRFNPLKQCWFIYRMLPGGEMVLMGSEKGYKERSEAVNDEILLLNEELTSQKSDAQAVLKHNTDDIFKQ